MVKKRNSFVVTDIKDYQKKTDEEVKQKSVKSKSSDGLEKKRRFSKNFEPKEDIKTNDGKSDRNEIKNEIFEEKRLKSNRFRNKCFESRREKGMILLSTKVENKIYKLKRSLNKKGLDPLEIKDIIRKRRREEENKYNKIMAKNCFKCRQSGHFLADCPLNANQSEEGVDICYRCGSPEHKLSECNQRSEGLPFAKCFLCSEIGHLTKDCKQNRRGVYPKGGECKACGSVNHLIKDCPQNQKGLYFNQKSKIVLLIEFDFRRRVGKRDNVIDIR